MTDEKPILACYCNNVPAEKVTQAIQDGHLTLPAIYDKTGAGTGPCGGSCRAFVCQLIREHGPQRPESVSKKFEATPAPMIEGVSLFNRRYYWECHEVLEHAWLEETGHRKKFYQGIIQAAAGFYHVLNANPQGVIKLAADSKAKLVDFAPEYLNCHIELLIASLDDFARQAREILGNERAGFDYDKLPRITIGNFGMSP